MAFALPDLPYAKDAFGDIISAETFEFHHGKHHNSYVKKTNDQLDEARLGDATLCEVIRKAKETGNQKLFNASAQIWNHSFFWQCLSPERQQPAGELKGLIERDFGSQEELIAQLKQECAGHFASGWGWLVLEGDKLKVTSLHDADTPVAHDGMKPLLTIDLWEHAYYIDYRNARPDYLDALLEKAINWDFVAQNLDGKGIERADQAQGALVDG